MSTTGESTPQATTPEPSTPARVAFTFEGRPLHGIEGQTIAAALFAAGERTLSYSVKYHRPRGIFCGRGRCANCGVEVDGAQGVKACVTPLRAGMSIRRHGSRPWFAGLLTLAARLIPFPAGFYYRFFTRPRWVRESFLGTLRRMAGVGSIDTSRSTRPAGLGGRPARTLPARYDVVVVGAGLSGMAAAGAAAEAGASVGLFDEYAHLGGHAAGALGDASVAAARDALVESVRRHDLIDVVSGATVQAIYDDRSLLVAPATGALERVRAGSVVLATGSLDTIPLFENNDLPGIFGACGLRLFLERDGVVPGTNAVIWGKGRVADDAEALLSAHGVRIAARVEEGAIVSASGGQWVRSVRVDRMGRRETVACDLVCVALPPQPDFTLAQQAGFTFAFDGRTGDTPVLLPTLQQLEAGGQRVFLAGDTAGVTAWVEKVEHAAGQGRLAARRVP